MVSVTSSNGMQPAVAEPTAEMQRSMSEVSNILGNIRSNDSDTSAWMDNVSIDAEGNFLHDVHVEGLSGDEVWGRFRDLAKNVHNGMSFVETTTELYGWKGAITAKDLLTAETIHEEVGSMFSEYEGLKAAVSTKSPDAVNNAVNTEDDSKVIAGMLLLIEHKLGTDPNADPGLKEVAATLKKIYDGEAVSEDELIRLEPHMESLGLDLFPPEVRPDFVVKLIEQAKTLQDTSYNSMVQSLS